MKYLKDFFFILLLCSVKIYSHPIEKNYREGEFTISIHLSDTQFYLPSPLTIVLEVKYPSDYKIDYFSLKKNLLLSFDPQFPPFNLVEQSTSTKKTNNLIVDTIQYTLQPVMEGNYPLSFFGIQFFSKQDPKNIHTIYTDIFNIQIRLPSKKENISTLLSPPLFIDPSFGPQLSWENKQILTNSFAVGKEAQRNLNLFSQRTIPLFAFTIWLLMIFGLLQYKRVLVSLKKFKAEFLDKKTTPTEEAIKKLNGLQKKLNEEKNFKEFMIHLCDIVRDYIEKEYRVKAPEKTTQEFLSTIRKEPIFNKELQERLSGFLIKADQVKFAQLPPTQADCLEAQQAALKFLTRTPPILKA